MPQWAIDQLANASLAWLVFAILWLELKAVKASVKNLTERLDKHMDRYPGGKDV
tara:strand:+ start:1579 stop:1740 length:162 start_codon:yes stop_codon:yes gene_type:complete